MKLRNKFDQDFDDVHASINDVVDCMIRKMPNEMVALVLLLKVRDILEDFADFDQWELLKPVLVDIRDDFERNIESHLSDLIDPGLDVENYNKRYTYVT